MKTQKVKLTNEEIKDQKKQADKYMGLIRKELSYGDLADWDNIEDYKECYDHAMGLINDPYIEMPVLN